MAQQFRSQLIYEAIGKGELLEYTQVQIEGNRISDALSDELKNLELPNFEKGDDKHPSPHLPKGLLAPILINAPTGSGKTTFVTNDLARKVLDKGLYVLLLSNRSALELQQKYELIRKTDIPQPGAETLSNMQLFGHIILLTYQSVLSNLAELKKYPIGVVVFDEAHFFCSDSTFNAWTEQILTNLIITFWDCKRIYMTATPDDVKPIIAYEEACLFNTIHNQGDPRYLYALGKEYSIREYYMPADYSYARLHFFHQEESIINLISKDNTENKWLIFTESKEKGRLMQRKIGKDATFIDSSIRNRDYRTFVDFARREMSEKRVLISTSVLDNGVNFNDLALKNIVIDSSDPVQLKQMLGRKRIQEGEIVDLYVKEKKRQDIYTSRLHTENLLKVLQDFSINREAYISYRWGSLTESEQQLFALCPQQLQDVYGRSIGTAIVVVANNYTEFQLARKLGRLDEIGDRFVKDGEHAFSYKVCGWLGLTYTPEMQIDDSPHETAEQKIIDTIDKYVEKPMSRDEARKLVADVTAILDKFSLPKSVISIKDTDSDVKGDINRILRYVELPYKCVKEKKYGNDIWRIIPQKLEDISRTTIEK